MKIDTQILIPENIKSIANRTSKGNLFVNDNERDIARAQIESIRDFCIRIINSYNKK